jgi:hypothetical protein
VLYLLQTYSEQLTPFFITLQINQFTRRGRQDLEDFSSGVRITSYDLQFLIGVHFPQYVSYFQEGDWRQCSPAINSPICFVLQNRILLFSAFVLSDLGKDGANAVSDEQP